MSSSARNALLAMGEQDNYLTQGTSDLTTYFKPQRKQYSAFAQSWDIITNNDRNRADFIVPGSSIYFRIPSDGDVITETYLRFKLNVFPTKPLPSSWRDYQTALSLIRSVDFMYNDRIIASLDKEYLQAYFETHLTPSQYDSMSFQSSLETSKGNVAYDKYLNKHYVYVMLPIPFWFHKNESNGFPMWLLSDPNVGLRVHTEAFYVEPITGVSLVHDIELMTAFQYIHPDEKKKLCEVAHFDYVIEHPERCEHQDDIPAGGRIYKTTLPDVPFVKSLVWFVSVPSSEDDPQHREPLQCLDDCSMASVLCNGNSIVDGPGSYFSLVQRFQYYQTANRTVHPIYLYSFNVDPMHHTVKGFVSTRNYVSIWFAITSCGLKKEK
jgi:hypothetical protein